MTDAKEAATLPWKEAVAAKQVKVKETLPKEWVVSPKLLASVDFSLTSTTSLVESTIVRDTGLLSDHELDITEKYNARQLLAKMARQELTSLEVTVAFSKRAAIAHQFLSCITEMFFDRAQERAAFLDDYLKKEGKVYGPLHGLPVSMKDGFKMVGIQSTIGYVSFLKHPLPTSNAALVDVLLRLGAVLYVKTNIPQTLMTADSENNIFGRTRNPNKMNLTAGGSSGGEGSLVAFRGSVLGVGTDIAGSIRIPALCNGVYGFKPTAERIPYSGQASPSLPGLPNIVPSAGPLATSMKDLTLFFRSVINAQPWLDDVAVLAVPYTPVPETAITEASLVIGLLPEDPKVPWHPPVRRAVNKAAAALEAAGHKIVPLPFEAATGAANATDISFRYFAMDPKTTGIQNIHDSGEPMIKTVADALIPASGKKSDTSGGNSLLDVADMNVKRLQFRNAWREIFGQYKLDVVLGPGAQHTAPKHDTYGPPAYTVIWNLLDYPSTIIPYGKASAALDPDEAGAHIKNPPYDAAAFDGAPTTVQISAPRFMDEFCLKASEIIDEVLQKSL